MTNSVLENILFVENLHLTIKLISSFLNEYKVYKNNVNRQKQSQLSRDIGKALEKGQSLRYFVLVFTFFLYTLLYPICLQEKICSQA